MKSIFLWVVSVLLLLLALGMIETSLLASTIFLIAGLFLLPPLRAKLTEKQGFRWISGRVQSSVLTLFLVITGIVVNGVATSSNTQKGILEAYEKNPAAFVSELKENITENNYYRIKNRVDTILEQNPQLNDLKAIRHEAMLAEIRYLSSKGELWRFDLDTSSYLAYKQNAGSETNLEELHAHYLKEVGKNFQIALSRKDLIEAKLQVERVSAILPNSPKVKSFARELDALESRLSDDSSQHSSSGSNSGNASQQAKVAISFVCVGNHAETVSSYVGLMDSAQIDAALGLMRANGCQALPLNSPTFTRGNSSVVRQGQAFIAIQRTSESVYAVTTVGAWNSP